MKPLLGPSPSNRCEGDEIYAWQDIALAYAEAVRRGRGGRGGVRKGRGWGEGGCKDVDPLLAGHRAAARGGI